jgi:hypothetical protein
VSSFINAARSRFTAAFSVAESMSSYTMTSAPLHGGGENTRRRWRWRARVQPRRAVRLGDGGRDDGRNGDGGAKSLHEQTQTTSAHVSRARRRGARARPREPPRTIVFPDGSNEVSSTSDPERRRLGATRRDPASSAWVRRPRPPGPLRDRRRSLGSPAARARPTARSPGSRRACPPRLDERAHRRRGCAHHPGASRQASA